MDLLAIRTQVRDIIGELVADFWTDAELTRYITEAQFRFLGEERWPWQITGTTAAVTGGTATVALAEGIEPSKIVALRLTKDGDTKTYLPRRVSPAKGFDLLTMYPTAQTSSYPEWYFISSVADADTDNLYIYTLTLIPTPTSAMTITFLYIRDAVDLTGDTIEPDLPVEYHKALVHYAAGTAWMKELREQVKAQEQFRMYQVVVDQARGEHLAEADNELLIVGGEEMAPGGRSSDPWLRLIPETLGP